MNYDVFTMYYSDKISFSYVVTRPSDQTPNLETTNSEFFHENEWVYFQIPENLLFGKNKSACQF